MDNFMSNQSGEPLNMTPARLSTIDVSSTDTDTKERGFVVYVGTGGDVKVDDIHGNTVTFKNVPDGATLPFLIAKIYSADTDAADMIMGE